MTRALEPWAKSPRELGLVEACSFSELRGPGREGRFRARCEPGREARLGAGLDEAAV
ncbi:MAG TPA: hypothetical protein VMN36_00545 [Verrucomicrobiales bacterium]|nr:hypothetical protein [Verrucomicrobiales bacterium]